MRFLRLAAFVNSSYPKYFTCLNSFVVSFVCAHLLRFSLVCELHCCIDRRYVIPFQGFAFFLSIFPWLSFFFPLLVEGSTVPLSLTRCSVAVVPLSPLPLFTNNLVHPQGWFLNFLIFLFAFF